MFAPTEIISEPGQVGGRLARLKNHFPRWREVPLYRDGLAAEDFSRLPFITKREIRKNFPDNFLRAGQKLDALLAEKSVELEHTSGTSDERTAVLFARGWWNAQEERVLRLNNFIASVLDAHPNARRATIVPPVCNGVVCFSNFMAKSARTLGSTLFVNQARIPFLLTDDELARMADEVSEWSPQFLDLDPVHGVWFARFCERRGIRFPSVKFILCSYEFVSVVHRKILQRVFGVPVFNLYGSTEAGHLLIENEAGEMRGCEENVFYEIINADENGVGELVVTTLTNEIMPLLRYRVGDLVQRDGENYLVHGRVRDALRRNDGWRVTTLEVDRCFEDISGIAHYQIRQLENGACDLQFILDAVTVDAGDLNRLTARLAKLLGLKQEIRVAAVEKLPPQTSGKFRLTSRAET
jgi:phenylacetate-CoA ligase